MAYTLDQAALVATQLERLAHVDAQPCGAELGVPPRTRSHRRAPPGVHCFAVAPAPAAATVVVL